MKVSRLMPVLMATVLAALGCSNNSAEDAKIAPSQPTTASAPAPATPAAPESAAKAAPVPEKPAAPEPPKLMKVPAGTQLTVTLIDSISTAKNKAGDDFTASVAEPVVINGKTVIAKGAKVHGRVVDAEGSGRVKGLANIRMVLTGVMNGSKLVPIVTKAFVAQAETTKGRDAAVAGGGAGVGAAVGAIAGGKKGAGLGALIGGAAGTGAVLATKGKEVEFDSESRLKFTLDKAAEVPAIGKSTS